MRRAIKERVNGITFDSQLEAEGYRILCSLFGPATIKCQYVVNLDYHHDGTAIQSIKHRVDFAVVDKQGEIRHLIEIKGVLKGRWHGRAEYAMILNLFRACEPELFKKYKVWVGDSTLSFYDGVSLPFVDRFPFSGVETASLSLSKQGII